MKSIDNKVLRELTDQELHERLEEERKQLLKLKMSHAVAPIESPIKIRLYRRNIARILTEINRRKKLNKK